MEQGNPGVKLCPEADRWARLESASENRGPGGSVGWLDTGALGEHWESKGHQFGSYAEQSESMDPALLLGRTTVILSNLMGCVH